jgi:quinoprotein glucose dehydrogenase
MVAFRVARQGEAPSLWSRTIDRPGGRFQAGSAVLLVILIATTGWLWRRIRRSRRAR